MRSASTPSRLSPPDQRPATSPSSSRVFSGSYSSADWLPALNPVEGDCQRRSELPNGSSHLPGSPGEPEIKQERRSSDGVATLPEVQARDFATLSPSFISTVPPTDGSTAPTEKSSRVQLVIVKRPGRRGYRVGIKLRRPRAPLLSLTPPVPDDTSQDETEPPSEVLPGFRNDFTTTFGSDTLATLSASAKLHATSGDRLPLQLRDLFPALAEPGSAMTMANALRANFGLPKLVSTKANRIALLRAVAQTREKLYIELVSALSLPLAPPCVETDEEEEEEVKPVVTLSPTNLTIMSETLPQAFPGEKGSIRAFLADGDAAYGEMGGRVIWQGGVGRMRGPEGPGFQGKTVGDSSCHVFVDQ